MFYLNITALGALAGIIFLLMLTRRWPQNKRILTLLFNIGFLLVFSQKLFLFYAVYTAANYAGYRLLRRMRRWRKTAFAATVVLNVGLVSAFRLFAGELAQTPWFDAVLTLGLIYNVLKVIDTYYFAYFLGKDAEAKAIEYFNFILFVPTFTSGPILRFRDFLADAKQPYAVGSADFAAGVKRIIRGMFKKIVLVYWMDELFRHVLASDLQTHHSLFLMVWFYLLIYFDFSGYSDIAIGFGRLMGYHVPENFKRPFLSPTLTQYWRNWHATLGDWFRDHIFMFFARKTPSKWTAAGLSLLIMVLIGLWHGFTWLYLLWGVYHGLLLAGENLLGYSLVNRRKVSKAYFYGRCLLTQLFVTAAVIVYSGDAETVLRIYRGLFAFPFL